MNILYRIQYQFAKMLPDVIEPEKTSTERKLFSKEAVGAFIEEVKNLKNMDQEQASHFAFAALGGLLIAFSLISSIVLLAISANNADISSTSGLTAFLMFVAIVISCITGGAIYASWKKMKWLLQMYQYACWFASVLLILILIGIALMSSSSTTSLLNYCNSPYGQFQYQMLTISNNAANLMCTANCTCPEHTKVQQCPDWQESIYDGIMEEMQKKFSCSGWCQPYPNTNFMFSGVSNQPSSGTCYKQWTSWIESQWSSIKGCITTIVIMLFCDIFVTRWRILKLDRIKQ